MLHIKIFGKRLSINKRRFIKAIIETVVVFTLTALLFLSCKAYAEIERGYSAFGGEYLTLGLPFIWYSIPHEIKKKEPAPSANDTSSVEKTVPTYYHESEELSSGTHA